MSSRSILFAVLLSAFLTCPAEAQVPEPPLTIAFGLRTTAFRSEQRIVVTTATSGLIPVLTAGWSCAWSRTPKQLFVECFPRDQEQGVTIRVGCSDSTPSGDIAAMRLSAHDSETSPVTEVVASCYSR